MTEQPVDKRNRLDEEFFSYQVTKDERILLFWYDKHIKTVAGKEAQKLLAKLEGVEGKEEQLILAKATGHFKHGNER